MRERIQWRLFIPVDIFSLINQNAAKDGEQKKAGQKCFCDRGLRRPGS